MLNDLYVVEVEPLGNTKGTLSATDNSVALASAPRDISMQQLVSDVKIRLNKWLKMIVLKFMSFERRKCMTYKIGHNKDGAIAFFDEKGKEVNTLKSMDTIFEDFFPDIVKKTKEDIERFRREEEEKYRAEREFVEQFMKQMT